MTLGTCEHCDSVVKERDNLRQALIDLIERVERDLHEPDKLLCAVLSGRRTLL
jgi:hypothetical protein